MRILAQSLCLVLSAAVLSCSRAPQSNYFTGEWASIETPLYLNIHRDSLSFIGHVPPTDWSDYRANPAPQGPNGWKGPFFQPPSSTFGFTVGKSQELIMHLYHNILDTLGIVRQDHDTLTLQEKGRTNQIHLVRLRADSIIRLDKIQFSATGCLGDCPIYDLELRPGSMIFAEPANGQVGNAFRPWAHFVGDFSQASFDECQEIMRKANDIGHRSRFETLVHAGNNAPAYSLTEYLNDSSYTVLSDARQCPSELLPLIPYLVYPKGRSALVPKDTTVLFRSRLRFSETNQDSLASREAMNTTRQRDNTSSGPLKSSVIRD